MIYLLFGAGCWFTFRPDLCSFATSASLAKVLKIALSTARRFNLISVIVYQSCSALGSGNLAGVALAITAGGPGASSGCGLPHLSAWRPRLPNVPRTAL